MGFICVFYELLDLFLVSYFLYVLLFVMFLSLLTLISSFEEKFILLFRYFIS